MSSVFACLHTGWNRSAISGRSRSATTPTGLLLGSERNSKCEGEVVCLSHFALVELSSIRNMCYSICNEANHTHRCIHTYVIHAYIPIYLHTQLPTNLRTDTPKPHPQGKQTDRRRDRPGRPARPDRRQTRHTRQTEPERQRDSETDWHTSTEIHGDTNIVLVTHMS